MFVYMIVNHETLKCYIGRHKGDDLQKYLRQKQSHARHNESEGSRLYRSMRAHPNRTAWSIHPIGPEILTVEELDRWEQFYIRLFHSQDPACGYNICRGGQGGFSGAPWNKGKKMPPRSEEHRRHLSESRLGYKPSAEQLKHQSEAQKGRPKPPRTAEHSRNNAEAQRGRKRSLEARANISAAHVRLPWSAARRAAFLANPSHPAWNKGKPMSEEQKAKLRGPRPCWAAKKAHP